jgi:transmembrane sensor
MSVKRDSRMNGKDYSNFEDFILDDSFREFVKGTQKKSVDFWETWILDHPEKKEEANRAKDVLIMLLGHGKKELKVDKNEALKILLAKIENQDPDQNKNWPKHISGKRLLNSFWVRAAAVIVLSIGLAWVWHALMIKSSGKHQQVTYNEIIVPVGEKSQVILSDGTHVWINSGSNFKYPLCFGLESREVSLEGEAYFDVTKGGQTFTINTHDAEIQVLGTAFNVKSYPEDKKTQTTVVRGLVRVMSKEKGIEPVLIGPEQMAVIKDEPQNSIKLANGKDLSVIDKVNTGAITSWKDQLLIFADETFEDIAIKMERWFNIKVRIEDEDLKKERYTGKFVNNETVYQVLEAIEMTTPIHYTVAEDEIIITRK